MGVAGNYRLKVDECGRKSSRWMVVSSHAGMPFSPQQPPCPQKISTHTPLFLTKSTPPPSPPPPPSTPIPLLAAEMGSQSVTIEDIVLPPSCETASAKTLELLGHGITDMEIHFLQIKFTAIGVYLHKDISSHLTKWKGKTADELVADDSFWEALICAPVEKLLRVVVIKEIKGSQYGAQLETAVRDRLVDIDKYEDEEEEALESILGFLQSKYFKKGSLLTFQFDAAGSKTLELAFSSEGKEDVKLTINNSNVAEMILKWYLGGNEAVSPTTITSLAQKFADILSSPAQM